MSGIFRAYDIRGRYPDELNESMAKKIGAAFVKFLHAKRIVVGRDMRLSSPALSKFFIDGAIGSGCHVVDIGMVTTPMLYYAIGVGNFEGGAMITASHLPADINGFKLCREKAIPLSGDDGLPIIERMVQEWVSDRHIESTADSLKQEVIIDKYIGYLASFVHNTQPLRIVVDAGNGMAGEEIVRLFRKFPQWQLISMYMNPDGSFPHHQANPLIISTTKDLQASVLKEKANIGAAFDGDADRCGFIDERGQRIPEDLVTALIAQSILLKQPGETILYDLRSSRSVPEIITKLGGKAVRCRVGHSFIKAQMRSENAIFAGELSGHYYFRDMGFTDNAVFAMLQMLNLLALKQIPLSELIKPLKKYFKTGEINIKVRDKDKIFTLLLNNYKDARFDRLDGLTIEYDSWWFNLRASNTELLIRLNLEASDFKTLEEKKKEIFNIINTADPGMIIADS